METLIDIFTNYGDMIVAILICATGTGGVVGIFAKVVSWLKAKKKKIKLALETVKLTNKYCKEYEQITDAEMLRRFNDNPTSVGKNKEDKTQKQRADALRKRFVITDVRTELPQASIELIEKQILVFCNLNKFAPKVVETETKTMPSS